MANQTITQLPNAGPITGNELVPIVQNGGTVKTTASALAGSPVQTQTFLTKNLESTLPNSRYLSSGTGIGLADGGAQSYYRITLNGVSGTLESMGNGFGVKIGGTMTARSITYSGSGITVQNGDGQAGNPSISLTGQVLSLANASGAGFVALPNNGTVTPRTILGTSDQINVSNGTGASGDPQLSIANDPIIPGAGGMTIPLGSSAQQPVGTPGQFRYNTDTQTFDGYSNGAWRQFTTSGGVLSFSAGNTGFTPSSSVTGNVTLDGTLNVSHGGTGVTTLTGYVYGNGITPMTASTTIPNTDITGLGTISTQDADNVDITGGSIDGTAIGSTSASTGKFTTVTATSGIFGGNF